MAFNAVAMFCLPQVGPNVIVVVVITFFVYLLDGIVQGSVTSVPSEVSLWLIV